LEVWADDLNLKLQAALEENIILHSEHDTYKSEADEMIQRLQNELEDAQNEIVIKEKIITRMNMHKDFLLKTAYNAQDDLSNDVLLAKQYSFLKHQSSGKINVVTPINNNQKVPEKFMQSYSKTFLNIQNENDDKYDDDTSIIGKNNDQDNSILMEKELKQNTEDFKSFGRATFIMNEERESKRNLNNLSFDMDSKRKSSMKLAKFINNPNSKEDDLDMDDEEGKDWILEKIKIELKNREDEVIKYRLNTLEVESFEVSLINNYAMNTNYDSNEGKNLRKVKGNIKPKKIIENIDDMLLKIQARKEKVLMQKKMMQNKLEKVGIKIS
jgi:hypothetical protein